MTKKFVDLSGETYGEWTVVGLVRKGPNFWECICSCGGTQTVAQHSLRTGGSTRCRPCANNIRKSKKVGSLVGKKFSRLTVTQYAGNALWECTCDCGNTKVTTSDRLKSGKTKSCGCYKIEKCLEKLKTNVESYRVSKGFDKDFTITDHSNTLHNSCTREKRAVKERDHWGCRICGVISVNLETHHIKPICLFPQLAKDLNNMITVCIPCHKQIHSFPIAECEQITVQKLTEVQSVGLL